MNSSGTGRVVKDDGHMLYIHGEYYVRQAADDHRYYVCDVDGIAPGEDLEHVGDDFDTLEEAKLVCDFYASGGHWQDLEAYYVSQGFRHPS